MVVLVFTWAKTTFFSLVIVGINIYKNAEFFH